MSSPSTLAQQVRSRPGTGFILLSLSPPPLSVKSEKLATSQQGPEKEPCSAQEDSEKLVGSRPCPEEPEDPSSNATTSTCVPNGLEVPNREQGIFGQ